MIKGLPSKSGTGRLHIPAYVILLLVLLMIPAVSARGENSQVPPKIRVVLASCIGHPSSLTITSQEAFSIVDQSTGVSVSDVKAGGQVAIAPSVDSIAVTVDDVKIGDYKGPVRIAAGKDDQTLEVTSPRLRNKLYFGVLEISGGKSLSVINDLDLEHYLYGVVPVEIPASFHPEARKALAIAARTYALKSLERHASAGGNVCDTTHCQGFAGASRMADWVRQTVDETRGLVAVHDGDLIFACYSADCGGATQASEDAGMSGKLIPYLRSVQDNEEGKAPFTFQRASEGSEPPSPNRRGVGGEGSQARPPAPENSGQKVGSDLPSPPSPLPQGEGSNSPSPACPRSEGGQVTVAETHDYCAASPSHTWKMTYKPDELGPKFSGWYGNKIGKFMSMAFTDYDPSGRVKTVLIKGDKGECEIAGGKLRELLGYNTLKSTMVALSTDADGNYVLNGRGFGHGMGLCQHGANGFAKSRPGITYEDVLKHYYTGIEIKPIAGLAPKGTL